MAPPAPATLPAALPQANGVLGWSRWQMARPRLAMDLCWMPPGPAMTWQKMLSPSSLLAPSWAVSPLQVAATVGPVGLLAWTGTTKAAPTNSRATRGSVSFWVFMFNHSGGNWPAISQQSRPRHKPVYRLLPLGNDMMGPNRGGWVTTCPVRSQGPGTQDFPSGPSRSRRLGQADDLNLRDRVQLADGGAAGGGLEGDVRQAAGQLGHVAVEDRDQEG